MFRFWIACKKEFLILWNDKTGLALMFFMPILLVFVITIIQDSAFQIVNENKITIIIVNKDRSSESDKLIEMMEGSGFFSITRNDNIENEEINKLMNDSDLITGLIIPPHFSEALIQKSTLIGNIMMEELDLKQEEQAPSEISMPPLQFYHDPVLRENYNSSIINVINAFVKSIEGDLLITQICKQLELEEAPKKLMQAMNNNQVSIENISASLSENDITPNSTQHNVPAWTIFAIFFMVIPLGNNIVKERLNGSFIRLKTMPTNFALVLGAKLFIYLLAVISQVLFVFSLAKYTFPFISLPELIMPSNVLAFIVVIIMTGLTAISFAAAVGTTAKTQEQANGFGAVAIVIFAAIGGILVPSFVMPDYMRIVSYGSPLYWCLEGFYTLFLRGGNWNVLLPTLLGLLTFSVACFGITFFQLKKSKII